jgi:hypothetical protein
MTDIPDAARPSYLWKRLSAERKLEAAQEFWRDDNARSEQAEAIIAIAARIKFRPKSVIGLPTERKASHLVSLPAISELVAARLLVVHHLRHQRPMMATFLDALGIKHEDGLIADDELKAPPPEKLAAAVSAISTAYPAEDVSLYLSTLLWQDADTWGGLNGRPEIVSES